MPELGDIGVTRTGGWAARLILWACGVGPWLHRTPAGVNHAVVFVGPQSFNFGDVKYVNEPAVVEGRPGGAGLAPVSEYPDAIWTTDALPLDPENGRCNAVAALAMIGTRYGWLNCLAIGLVRLLGWKAPDWALRVLASRRWAECAQLADYAWTDGAAAYERATLRRGLHLFDDGRQPGLVSPQDILEVIEAHSPVPLSS